MHARTHTHTHTHTRLQSLCQFCSKVLEELEIVINDLETQFQSGVNMVLMMGLLEGYYIPHYLWHYSPKNFEERVSSRLRGNVWPGGIVALVASF